MEEQSFEEVTAVVLAGGLGTRLRSVVADRPKVMAEVLGRPFLAHLLDQLAAAGIRYTVLCTGYFGEQVQACFGAEYAGMRLAYSQERAPLGTGGALRAAAPLLRSEHVLVLNGDSYYGINLRSYWSWHQRRRPPAALATTLVPDTRRYGRVHLTIDGCVSRFAEKEDSGGPGWINAGVYLLHQRVFVPIPTERAVSLEREVLPDLVRSGLLAYRCEGPFLDIGTPESYAMAEEFFAAGAPA